MLRGSTGLIGVVNFITFLVSIPILAGGIWLSTQANNTDCVRVLQWASIIIGLTIFVVSLMGFAGACYRISWLLRLYLFVMFFVIVALVVFIIFAYSVTDRGGGQVIMNRGYYEYQLSDYSGWLRDRVSDPNYWDKVRACLHDAGVCKGMAQGMRDPVTGMRVPESADTFYQRHLTPIESGCCKPPTSCGFTYVNETYWTPGPGTVISDPDCTRWNNDQQLLCYQCDSCKAGVLASIRHSWRKVSVINVVVLIILVIVYVVGCAAFRNSRKIENDEPFGANRMTKARPSRIQF